MSIAGVKTTIQTSIQTVFPGLQCFTGFPSAFTPPCVYIMTGPVTYNVQLMQTKQERTFEITLVVARAEALEDAQAKVEAYLLPTGTTSMQVAIQNASVSTDADFIRAVEDTGVIPLTINATEYIGCKWKAKVMI